jgi:hypothetical protein
MQAKATRKLPCRTVRRFTFVVNARHNIRGYMMSASAHCAVCGCAMDGIIDADIQKFFDALIAYDDLRHGYYFDGPAPEFGPVALSERVLFGLCFMGKALEQFRGTTVGRTES